MACFQAGTSLRSSEISIFSQNILEVSELSGLEELCSTYCCDLKAPGTRLSTFLNISEINVREVQEMTTSETGDAERHSRLNNSLFCSFLSLVRTPTQAKSR